MTRAHDDAARIRDGRPPLTEECRKRGIPTSMNNPMDLDPAGYARAASAAGAVPVAVDRPDHAAVDVGRESLDEGIVYDALHSIMQASKVLCELVNKHGTDADKKAYRDGVYSPAVKLQIVLGTDGMERGKARYEAMAEEMRRYVARKILAGSGPGVPPISQEPANVFA